jgi:hypothetical protein
MNVARDLLDDLAIIGATVEPAGDRLILRAGSTAIPARLVSRVREAKAELVALLTESTHVAPSESIKTDPLARKVHRAIGPIGLMKAMDSVPKRYLAAWGQFQCQYPASMTEQAWQIKARNDSLDIGWLRDTEVEAEEHLTDPEDIAAAIIGHLEAALEEVEAVSEELEEEEQAEAAGEPEEAA